MSNISTLILISRTRGPHCISEYTIPKEYCFEVDGNSLEDLKILLTRLYLLRNNNNSYSKALNVYNRIINDYKEFLGGSFALIRKD